MSEAGFNTVRLAEFAWSKIELKEGEYHFEWLDTRAICFPEEHKGKTWHSYGCSSTGIVRVCPDILRINGYGENRLREPGRVTTPATRTTTNA